MFLVPHKYSKDCGDVITTLIRRRCSIVNGHCLRPIEPQKHEKNGRRTISPLFATLDTSKSGE
jgi:hypothetical protein